MSTSCDHVGVPTIITESGSIALIFVITSSAYGFISLSHFTFPFGSLHISYNTLSLFLNSVAISSKNFMASFLYVFGLLSCSMCQSIITYKPKSVA